MQRLAPTRATDHFTPRARLDDPVPGVHHPAPRSGETRATDHFTPRARLDDPVPGVHHPAPRSGETRATSGHLRPWVQTASSSRSATGVGTRRSTASIRSPTTVGADGVVIPVSYRSRHKAVHGFHQVTYPVRCTPTTGRAAITRIIPTPAGCSRSPQPGSLYADYGPGGNYADHPHSGRLFSIAPTRFAVPPPSRPSASAHAAVRRDRPAPPAPPYRPSPPSRPSASAHAAVRRDRPAPPAPPYRPSPPSRHWWRADRREVPGMSWVDEYQEHQPTPSTYWWRADRREVPGMSWVDEYQEHQPTPSTYWWRAGRLATTSFGNVLTPETINYEFWEFRGRRDAWQLQASAMS